MSTYRSGTYRGPSNRLGGKHAILLPAPALGWVLAQFDDLDLPEALGWHPFPEGDFKEDEPINWDESEGVGFV